jgi:3D (Asp-Asp-Asp) domain-containing protein
MMALARYYRIKARLIRYTLGTLAGAVLAILAGMPTALDGRPVLLQMKVEATSYACAVCNGSKGQRLQRGMIAVSDDLQWLWGRKVRVNGREFLVRDRMADNWRKRIDIYTPVEAEAWQWGIQKVTLEVER